ncbi:MAG: M55 family metallopeptidase [Armatimonadetes bacterium]|nr:M55 family metallopeptidase [Armatimonadota bacterium]
MKIYMITDMEGVGGVINESHVFSDRPYYEKAREWLTLDVNAAVQGAIEGGATEVLVCDGHGANSACNMLYEKLHEGAQYIQGTPWSEYLQDLAGTFGGMFHIGAHAMSGMQGAVLEHTMSSAAWVEMRINGTPMGEIGLCAAAAGHFGVPFIMVSGDDKACAESEELVPGIECAVVKYGIGRTCARLLPMPVVHRLIREKAKAAVQRAKAVKPFVVESPVEIEIEYMRTNAVDGVIEREGVRKIGPRTVRFTGCDIDSPFLVQ